jgi:O-antigen ligase
VVGERFDPSTSEDVRSYTSGRTELWKNGWKLIVDSPLIGHGRNSFRILSQLRGYRYYGSPYNEDIRASAEHGLIGLIVFLLIFFKIFQNIWQSLETTTNSWGKQLYISYIILQVFVVIWSGCLPLILVLLWLFSGFTLL